MSRPIVRVFGCTLMITTDSEGRFIWRRPHEAQWSIGFDDLQGLATMLLKTGRIAHSDCKYIFDAFGKSRRGDRVAESLDKPGSFRKKEALHAQASGQAAGD